MDLIKRLNEIRASCDGIDYAYIRRMVEDLIDDLGGKDTACVDDISKQLRYLTDRCKYGNWYGSATESARIIGAELGRIIGGYLPDDNAPEKPDLHQNLINTRKQLRKELEEAKIEVEWIQGRVGLVDQLLFECDPEAKYDD